MNVIPLNIVMTYPVCWNKYRVLRDFVQNFYDAVGYSEWKKEFHYSYDKNRLCMWIENETFSYEWLLHIGASTKTSNNGHYAGFFGEGFKMASLCAIRDLKWDVQMMSDNWSLRVTSMIQTIENSIVKMLAYEIEQKEKEKISKLVLENISSDDYELFCTVLNSFYYPENTMMGKVLWENEECAVYLRSQNAIDSKLPSTKGFSKKGAVFCAFQMLGTNPFNLVVCYHRYRNNDRERNTLYEFDVIKIFEKVCYYIDAECAMVMLEKMRRYWNSRKKTLFDINSWSNVINNLVWKIAGSQNTKETFVKKYNNLLCVKKIYSVGEKNKRSQARTWLLQQDKHYILVKGVFSDLGYPTLEEECEKQGGFVLEEDVKYDLQNDCFQVLENLCKDIFEKFFLLEEYPERKIITNMRAVYHGMAVVHKKRNNKEYNNIGLQIRYEVGKIYLKKSIFCLEGYYDAVSTYIHEMCHMFGGDSSNNFSLALTWSMGLMLQNQAKISKYENDWKSIFDSQ